MYSQVLPSRGRAGGRAETLAAMSDELRAYLLDKLTPEERSRLEERMFADDEFFDRMLDAENDLADDYAAGELSPPDAAAICRQVCHRKRPFYRAA